MGFFSWIIFVIIIVPAFIGAATGLLKTVSIVSDDKPMYSPLRIIIELSLSAILIIWSIVDISNGIFSSLKTVCFFGIKILAGGCLFIYGIKHLIIKLHQDSWNSRIDTVLNGELGKEIKKYLYNNSYEYIVYDDRIRFDKEGEMYYLKFADLGYLEIPANSADAVCQWIRQNVVIQPDLYRIERESEQQTDYSNYTGGTSDSYTVTPNYSGGYDVDYHSGTSGEFGTKTVTLSYKLTRKPYKHTVAQPDLKKW